MDSIQAKMQQFQTSVQSLYVGSGLENAYKGLLDFGNNIIKTFTAMPKILNLPIPAIAKFGSQFASLAVVVTNGFKLVKNIITRSSKEITLLGKIASGERLTSAEMEAAQKYNIIQRSGTEIVNAERDAQNRQTAEARQGAQDRIDIQMNAQKKLQRSTKLRTGGMIANVGGLALSTIAGGMEAQTESERYLKAGATGVGAAFQGIGTGLMIGGIPGGILGTLSALPGIVEAFGIAIETTAEKVSRLNQEIENTNNERIKAKDELKTLDEYKKKFDELKITRHKDAESYKEWIDLNNEIVAKYPELISYIDTEGNAIAELSGAYDGLRAAKAAVYSQKFLENSKAEVAAASDIDVVLNKLGISSPKEVYKNRVYDGTTVLHGGLWGQALAETLAQSPQINEEAVNNAINKANSMLTSEDTGLNVLKTLFSDLNLGTEWLGIGTKKKYVRGFEGLEYDPRQLYTIETLTPLIEDVISGIVHDNLRLEDLNQYLSDKYGEMFHNQGDYTITVREEVYRNLKGIGAGSDYISDYGDKIIDYYIQQAAEVQKTVAGITEDSQIVNDAAIKEIRNQWNNREAGETWEQFYLRIAGDIENIYGEKGAQKILSSIRPANRKQVEEIYNNLESQVASYSSTGEISIAGLDELGVADSPELMNLIKEKWIEDILIMRNNFIEYVNSLDKNSKGEDLDTTAYDYERDILDAIAPQFWSAIQSQLEEAYADIETEPDKAIGRAEQINAAWQAIGQLDAKQKEIASGILSNADLTSLVGIYSALEELSNKGIVEFKDRDKLYTALTTLTNHINVNLVTEFASFADKVTKQVDEFDKALSNASKGMALDEAIAMADKLGVSIDAFRFEGGKYFYDTAAAIKEAYYDYNEQLLDRLNKDYEALLNGGLYPKGAVSEYGTLDIIKDNIAEVNLRATDEESRNAEWQKILVGIDPEQISASLDLYNKYFESWQNDGSVGTLTDYVAEQLSESKDAVEAATRQYGDYQVNAILIQNGFIVDFLKNAIGLGDDAAREMADALRAGKFDSLPEELKQYIPLVMNYVNGIGKGVIDKAMAVLKGEGNQYIEVNESNRDLLKTLGVIDDTVKNGEQVILDSAMLTLEQVQALINYAFTDAGLITEQQSQSSLAELHNLKYKDNMADALTSVVSNYESFGIDAAQSLANALDSSVDDLSDQGIINVNELTGKFSITLQQLRQYATQALSQGMSIESYNELISQIEQAEHQSTVESVMQDVIKNRTSLTEENIRSLANSFNTTYDYVEALLTRNDDGTFTMSLASIDAIVEQGKLTLNDSLKQLIAEQIDNVIGSITGLAANQGRGYTNIADMQKYVQQVKDSGIDKIAGKDINMDVLFDWNDSINAFVLTTEGIISQVVAAKVQLDSFTKDSDEYEAITKLIESTGRQFAGRIDVTSILESNEAASTAFKSAIEDYNAYRQAIGETLLLDSKVIEDRIKGGGSAAVSAAEYLAELAGKQLSKNDIESIYNNEVAEYLNAINEVNSSIGSIISSTTANLDSVKIHVQEIGTSGQYVVTSAINLVDAYQNLYDKLTTTSEATLSDLNKVMALKFEAEHSSDAITALSNAAEMTYTQFGEILTKKGIALTETLITNLDKNKIIKKDIGGGKLRITNFEYFAELMGWDRNSEQYISAFSSYNDAMVELNHQTQTKIAEELNNALEAAPGDQINMTNLFKSLDSDRLDKLRTSINKWGADLYNGILYLSDTTNISQVVQEIAQTAEEGGNLLTSDVAALQDALDELLQTFAEAIANGIKGSLSNADAQKLKVDAKNILGIDLDFYETADGLKIANDQAIKLYNGLGAIDNAAASIVFDGLRESLEAAGEDCENITKTMANINSLEAEMNKHPNNAKLAERLNLYKQIAAVQMQDPSQYDFMGRSLPDYLQGPENYWNSIGQAFTSMKEAASTGYMEIADFYNIVNEMNNLAALGGDIEFLGMTLNGSLESASMLIQKGMTTLTNIDGEGVKINLGEFGVDIAEGADMMSGNVEDGINAMAQSQIDMLDGMIALLETVVAMEGLSDVAGKDTTITLGELFVEDEEGNLVTDKSGKKKYEEKYKTFAETILAQAEGNENLSNALEQVKIENVSLKAMFEDATDGVKDVEISEEKYLAAIQALYDMYISGDYDLENPMASIIEIAKNSEFEGEIEVGDKKFAIRQGAILEADKDNYYCVANQTFENADEAWKAYELQQYGGQTFIYNKQKELTSEITLAKQIITIAVNKEGEIEYRDEGGQFLGYSRYEALQKLYERYSSDASVEGIKPKEYSEWVIEQEGEFVAGEIKVTNAAEFESRTQEEVQNLANAIAGGNTRTIVEAAKEIGITVEVKDIDTDTLTAEQLTQLSELAGIESEPIIMDITPNFVGDAAAALADLLIEKIINVTVNLKKGIDEVGLTDNNNQFSKKIGTPRGEVTPVIANFDTADISNAISASIPNIKNLPADAANKVNALADSMEELPNVASHVDNLSDAMSAIPSDAASRIAAVAEALNRIPFRKVINIIATVKVNANGGTVVNQAPVSNKPIQITKSDAKGNVALAGGRKTLMGELGAELVVSKGRYFLVGQNGAEMVDLPDDAIVFNHLQTKQLLSNGMSSRGKAVTNERNATSMATGNAEGPAMASASAALSALKQIRAMWQSMLDASLKDLGQQAGSGGGGGGGDKDKNTLTPGFIADLERWYNLLRQIERLEKSINYEEKLRQKLSSDTVSNGKAYYESQKRSLEALQQQIVKNEELSHLQKSYYDARRQDLANTNFGKIFTFNENGLMQYNDTATMANGDKGGLFALAKINAQNADSSPVYTMREQYDLLKQWGFDEELKYDNEGNLIEWTDEEGKARDEAYTEAVQAFWDKVDGWKDELDSLYDSYNDSLNDLLDEEAQRNEILNEMRDNQLSLEQSILKAIENREQQRIDDFQDEINALEEATNKYIEGLNDQLNREREMYQREQEGEELNKLRRQLAILQRSGGSASQIRSLQNQITTKEQDTYFNAQQTQIDAIKTASDREIETLNAQLEVMKESLEYQKENGLLWGEVSQIMAGTPAEIENFLATWSPEFKGVSALDFETKMNDLKSSIDQWAALRDDSNNPVEADRSDEAGTGWKAWAGENQGHYQKVWDSKSGEAEKAYRDAYAINSNPIEAATAARKVFEEALAEYYRLHPEEDPKNRNNQVQLENSGGNQPIVAPKPEGTGVTAPKPSVSKPLVTLTGTSNWKTDSTYHWKVETYSNGTTKIIKKAKHNRNKKIDTGSTWTCYCDVCNYYMGIVNKSAKVNSGGCFVAGTKIIMGDKSIKNIEDVLDNEFVLAYNTTTGIFEPYRVIKSYAFFDTPRVIDITLSDGTVLGITPGHPILTTEGWKSRDQAISLKDHEVVTKWLNLDDEVLQYNKKAKVIKIEEHEIPEHYTTYNLAVDECHTYIANGVIVHNALKPALAKMQYSKGGLADYTGLAMVHGSKEHPEAFLNAAETKMWKDDILSGRKGSLTNSLVEFQSMVEQMTAVGVNGNTTSDGSIIIEHAEVNVDAEVANDYDARRIGQNALEEMVKIARKSSVQSIRR